MLAENEYQALKTRLEKVMKAKIRPKKIAAIHVNSANHWQPPLFIKVGEKCGNLEQDTPPEEIIAIFESTIFLICTQKRGIETDLPYFFSREDVTQVIEFPSD